MKKLLSIASIILLLAGCQKERTIPEEKPSTVLVKIVIEYSDGSIMESQTKLAK